MKQLKKVVYFFSYALIGFICFKFYPDILRVLSDDNLPWYLFPASILLYCLGIFLIALSWSECLQTFKNAPSKKNIFLAYAVSSIAKYIPGNIAQPAGRIYLLAKLNVPKKVSGFSLLIETVLAVLACVLISIFSIYLFPSQWRQVISEQFWKFVTIAAILFVSLIILWNIRGLREKITTALSQIKHRWARIFLPMLLAFIVLSFNCALIGNYILGGGTDSFWACFFVFGISWILGFVTPGAPAGLGTREVVFVFFLSQMFSYGSRASVAIALRVVSVLGDLIIFLTGSFFSNEAS